MKGVLGPIPSSLQEWRAALTANGWRVPLPEAHPLVAETWRAAERIYPPAAVRITPVTDIALQLPCGKAPICVHVKREDQQATNSFKARGAANKLFSCSDEQLMRGVCTASTGNHALGYMHAWAARTRSSPLLQGMQASIYLPESVSPAKADKLRAQGAQLHLTGSDCIEAETLARASASEKGVLYVSPYNDLQVAGGQGTVALELMAQLPRSCVSAVYVPVGGGGLIAGIAAFLKASDPDLPVVGCQPAASDVMRRSVVAGRVIEMPFEETLSDGTAGGVDEDSITLDPCTRYVDRWVSADERDIAMALLELRDMAGMRVEGAAAMGAACLRADVAAQRIASAGAGDRKGANNAAVLVCCGGNVSDEVFEKAAQLVAAG